MAQFTPAQLEKYKSTFKIFDLNDDGSISNDELAVVFLSGITKRLGYNLPSAKLADVVKRLGMGEKGEISFNEFLTAIPGNTTELTAEDHRQATIRARFAAAEESKIYLRAFFNQFDLDKSGFIDMCEAKEILQTFKFEENEIERLIKDHDTNGDGKLDYEEFIVFWGHCH